MKNELIRLLDVYHFMNATIRSLEFVKNIFH